MIRVSLQSQNRGEYLDKSLINIDILPSSHWETPGTAWNKTEELQSNSKPHTQLDNSRVQLQSKDCKKQSRNEDIH